MSYTEIKAVWEVVKDGRWWTLNEITAELWKRFSKKHIATSVSARLRDLRKQQYGGYTVERRVRDKCEKLYEYRLSVGGCLEGPRGSACERPPRGGRAEVF